MFGFNPATYRETKTSITWAALPCIIDGVLSLLVKGPYYNVISGVCSNNFVAQGFYSVEHQIRRLSDSDREAVTLCAQVYHKSVELCELALVNMTVDERWLPKCHFSSWTLAKTARDDIRHGSSHSNVWNDTSVLSIVYDSIYGSNANRLMCTLRTKSNSQAS